MKSKGRILIETKRLILRELTLDDTDQLAEILCDRESMKYYPRPLTKKETEEWITRNIKRYREGGYGLLAVILKEGNLFLGDCGITLQDIEGELLPELGYHIKSEYRNRGYATEASKGCIDYGIPTLNLSRLYTYTKEDNFPSRKVAEKNGMEYIKSFEKNVWGEQVIEVLYSMDLPRKS